MNPDSGFDPSTVVIRGWDNLLLSYKNLDSIDSIDALEDLREGYYDWDNAVDIAYNTWLSEARRIFVYPPARLGTFKVQLKRIHDRILALIDATYPQSHLLEPGPIPCNWLEFVEYVDELCLDEDQGTQEEFTKWLKANLCTDWHKMDTEGESYGGFWRYPEGSDERENAWDLSYAANTKALLDLPYPYRLIKTSITYGCNTRRESVKFSREVCEWFDRMIQKTMPERYEEYRRNCRAII